MEPYLKRARLQKINDVPPQPVSAPDTVGQKHRHQNVECPSQAALSKHHLRSQMHEINDTSVGFGPDGQVTCELPGNLYIPSFSTKVHALDDESQYALLTVTQDIATRMLAKVTMGYIPKNMSSSPLAKRLIILQYELRRLCPWYVWLRSPHLQKVPDNEDLRKFLRNHRYNHAEASHPSKVIDNTVSDFMDFHMNFLKIVTGTITHGFLDALAVCTHRSRIALCLILNHFSKYLTGVKLHLVSINKTDLKLLVGCQSRSELAFHVQDVTNHTRIESPLRYLNEEPIEPTLDVVLGDLAPITRGINHVTGRGETNDEWIRKIADELINHVVWGGYKLFAKSTGRSRLFYYTTPARPNLLVGEFVGERLTPGNFLQWLCQKAGSEFIDGYQNTPSTIKHGVELKLEKYMIGLDTPIKFLPQHGDNGLFIFGDTSIDITTDGVRKPSERLWTFECESVHFKYTHLRDLINRDRSCPPTEFFVCMSSLYFKGHIIHSIKPSFRPLFAALHGFDCFQLKPCMWYMLTDQSKMYAQFTIYLTYGQYAFLPKQGQGHYLAMGPQGTGKTLNSNVRIGALGPMKQHKMLTSDFGAQILADLKAKGVKPTFLCIEDITEEMSDANIKVMQATAGNNIAVKVKLGKDVTVPGVSLGFTTNNPTLMIPKNPKLAETIIGQLARRTFTAVQSNKPLLIPLLDGEDKFTHTRMRLWLQLMTSGFNTHCIILDDPDHHGTPVAQSRKFVSKILRFNAESDMLFHVVSYILYQLYENPEFMILASDIVSNTLDCFPPAFKSAYQQDNNKSSLTSKVIKVFSDHLAISRGHGSRNGCMNCISVNLQIRIVKGTECPVCKGKGRVREVSKVIIGYGRIIGGGNEDKLFDVFPTYFPNGKPLVNEKLH